MNAQFYKWEGAISLLWVALGFLVILFFKPFFVPIWLFLLILFAGWWGVGLVLAISGIKHGHWVSRVCAVLSICAFVFFVWAITHPVASR
jgi:hypothetical protein